MADIDIQEKKGSIWPWILGLLGLILVAWLVMEMLDDDDDVDPVVTDTQQTPYTAPPPPAQGMDAGMPAAVTQFEEQCASASTTTDEMALDHAYAETCIEQMTAAMQAVIERDTVNDQALAQQLETYRTHATQLTQNRESAEHSTHVREVFDGAAEIIARIEETREGTGATLERHSGRVQEAAEAFSADTPMMDQRDEVAAFFREAAAALRAMAT